MSSRPLLALVLALGCGGAGPRDEEAQHVARRWAAAVTADDPRAAYDLLSDEVRRHKDFQAFAGEWRDSAAERARQGAALQRSLAGGAQLGERGEVRLADGQTMPVAAESGGWRLARPLVASVRPQTPEEALRRLADALEERSFPALLRLLTTERQEATRDLLEAFVTGLRAHAPELVEVSEDRATLVWTDGSRRWRVVLKREQGAWHIDDFSPQ